MVLWAARAHPSSQARRPSLDCGDPWDVFTQKGLQGPSLPCLSHESSPPEGEEGNWYLDQWGRWVGRLYLISAALVPH